MFETSYLLYQTLENRGNYEQNEKDGPYNCSWDNTWLERLLLLVSSYQISSLVGKSLQKKRIRYI